MWRDGLSTVGREQLPGGNPTVLLQMLRAAGGSAAQKAPAAHQSACRAHLGQMLDLDPSYQVLRLSFKVLGSESLFWVAAFLFLPYDRSRVPTPVGGLGWRYMGATVRSVSCFVCD